MPRKHRNIKLLLMIIDHLRARSLRDNVFFPLEVSYREYNSPAHRPKPILPGANRSLAMTQETPLFRLPRGRAPCSLARDTLASAPSRKPRSPRSRADRETRLTQTWRSLAAQKTLTSIKLFARRPKTNHNERERHCFCHTPYTPRILPYPLGLRPLLSPLSFC